VALGGFREDLKKKASSIPGLKYSTLNIGVIKGGEKSNMLADSCTIDVDLRIIPELNVEEILKEIERILEELREEDASFSSKMEVIMKAEPSVTPSDLPIIQSIMHIGKDILGFEPKPVGLQATSDGKYFRKKGIPTIHWGVGTEKNRAHGPDEHIEIEDLLNLTAAHALVAIDYLGYEKS
jgi:succinyl-diaminopimelate desuccinylase